MLKKTRLTHAELKKRLSYNRDTGVITWTNSHLNTIHNKVAGSIHTATGLRCIQINGEKWIDRQIAWYWVTGKVPNGIICNKDKNKNNCRFDNLELIPAKNKGIKSIHADGKGGFKVRINGAVIGSADTVEECEKILNKYKATQYILAQRALKKANTPILESA